MTTHALTILATDDVARLTAFYRDGLGLSVVVSVGVYSELIGDGLRLGLYAREGFAHSAGATPTLPPGAAIRGTELYFHVADPAEASHRLVAAGARPLSPLSPRDWGDEAAYHADPDGNVVVVARPLPPEGVRPVPAPDRSRIVQQILGALPGCDTSTAVQDHVERAASLPLLGAFDAERCVGLALLQPHGAHTLGLLAVGVLPAHQRCGWGTRLIGAARLEALDQRRRWLSVRLPGARAGGERHASHAFFEAQGFALLEQLPARDGRGPCALLLRGI